MGCVCKVKSSQLTQKLLEPFKKELQDVMECEGLTLEQIYNCDKTGLYYNMLPTKTLATKAENNASGIKKQKERVTLMACSLKRILG